MEISEQRSERRRRTLLHRRAPVACEWCHGRRVRCDVSWHGPPCTNCRLDCRSCSVRESKKRRRQVNVLYGSRFEVLLTVAEIRMALSRHCQAHSQNLLHQNMALMTGAIDLARVSHHFLASQETLMVVHHNPRLEQGPLRVRK